MKTITTKELSIPYLSNSRSRTLIDDFQKNTQPISKDIDILIELNRLKNSPDFVSEFKTFLNNYDSKFGYSSSNIPLEIQFLILDIYRGMPQQVKQKLQVEAKMSKIVIQCMNHCYSMYEPALLDNSTIPNNDTETMSDSLLHNNRLVDDKTRQINRFLNYKQNTILRSQMQMDGNTQSILLSKIADLVFQHGKKYMKDVLFPSRLKELNDIYYSMYEFKFKFTKDQWSHIMDYNPYSQVENMTDTPISKVTEQGVQVTQLGKKLKRTLPKSEKLKIEGR